MKTNKKLPHLKSDSSAQDFVQNADLTQYDLSAFKKTTFEFAPRTKTISLRLSNQLYNVLQRTAKKEGIKTQKFIRKALENALGTQ